jgi:hypothetical protein
MAGKKADDDKKKVKGETQPKPKAPGDDAKGFGATFAQTDPPDDP